MANAITLAKKYVSLIDEVYKEASLTAVLDGDPSLARDGANANEIMIPKLSMDGLADYDRNSGYAMGDVTLTWETVKFNYERGRKFQVDEMDNEETQNVAFGNLAGEFVRTKVAPELDAFRFAAIAGTTGISKVSAGATLSTGADTIAAISAGATALDEAEVPQTGRYLFITPTLKRLIDDMDTTKSKEVLASFESVIQVPQTRFYTAIDLLDGKDHTGSEGADETAGGYAKASAGKDINFMIIHKPAILQYTKHAVPKIIPPAQNQDADAYIYAYRIYGLADVYENKLSGVYLHHKA